jgi:hypothetical protein
MVFKTLLILLVVAVLLEDSMSVKKKTKEEEEEDERVAKEVNATLAAEEAEKKKEEEEKKRAEKSKMTGKMRDQDKKKEDTETQVGQGEDCPPCNNTCPEVEICHPCGPCPEERPCLEVDCHPCPPCKECPEEKPCSPCRPCMPCPALNCTGGHQNCPSTPSCPEAGGMSASLALAVGVLVGLLCSAVAAAIGLILRYVPPIASGFLFLATIVIIWYLCSHYPETARELGGRAASLLREAATALSHRVMAAIRHHDQVSFFNKPELFLRLSSMSQKFALRFSM